MIWTYASRLLACRNYAAAGILLWGTTVFNPFPGCVQDVFKAINDDAKVMVIGGGSVGKSYSGIAWVLLDWLADPEYTTVKIVSTTGGHARSNTFSTITDLHGKKSICPLPGIANSDSISLTQGDKRACISIVRIQAGEDNSGTLQGFHPLPREVPHPVFGASSRVRAMLDEAEEIAGGVWAGVDNMLTSIDGKDTVKVMAFFNPKDITSKTAQLCEPVGGWGEFNVETGVKGKNKWRSREGWSVLRIDPKNTENVKERKIIYTGLQSFAGYTNLQRKDGGNSLSYFTFGRGAYPPDGAVCSVVPQRVMDLLRGEFIFTGKTVKIGGADIAIDGRDEAVMAVGRMGLASGFRRAVYNEEGPITWEVKIFDKERNVLQMDQIFTLPKGSSKIVGDAIRDNAKRLGVDPANMMIDATGNGAPVLNYLQIPEVWSPEVRGIDFSCAATDTRILAEDSKTAEEEYEGIHTEVWFALSRWGEYGYFAISPTVRSENLERELTGRRYIQGEGKKLVVEQKKVYKKRLSRSPDNADTATIFVHCARTSGTLPNTPSMTGEAPKQRERDPFETDFRAEAVTWLPGGI